MGEIHNEADAAEVLGVGVGGADEGEPAESEPSADFAPAGERLAQPATNGNPA